MRLNYINELYDLGHEIHYWTARGTVTGINHKNLQKNKRTRTINS